jgi:predicted DsbA family dithiol-disulfide isomerase
MALESDQIRADAIESMEFPHLAIKYQVMAVPRTVINEKTYIDGAIPEAVMVEQILNALGKEPSKS